jgi:hypothetical protein
VGAVVCLEGEVAFSRLGVKSLEKSPLRKRTYKGQDYDVNVGDKNFTWPSKRF